MNLHPITPRLGLFGSFYNALGDPELDTVGLTKWLSGLIIQGKAATYLSNLEQMFSRSQTNPSSGCWPAFQRRRFQSGA